MRRSLRLLPLAAWLGLIPLPLLQLHAQRGPARDEPKIPVSFRVTATRANSPPGSCGCFYLLGGAADVSLPLGRGFHAVLEAAGNHAGSVPQTARGLSTITLLAGPRYVVPVARRQTVFAQALFGAARGFDAEFRRGSDAADTATGLAYAFGGAYEARLSRGVTLRPVQIDYVQTNLPNGADGRQRNLRFSTGIVFRIGLAGLER